MNHPGPHRLTVEEFIDWAMAQPKGRYELDDGRIVTMSPERVGHIRAKFNVALALTKAVGRANTPLHVLTDGATVRIDAHTAYEPDALVYGGPELPDSAIEVPRPVLVVEVLSPSTSRRDTVVKAERYFEVASIEAYLVIDPDARSVQIRRREAGTIMSATLTQGVITLSELGLELPVGDLLDAA